MPWTVSWSPSHISQSSSATRSSITSLPSLAGSPRHSTAPHASASRASVSCILASLAAWSHVSSTSAACSCSRSSSSVPSRSAGSSCGDGRLGGLLLPALPLLPPAAAAASTLPSSAVQWRGRIDLCRSAVMSGSVAAKSRMVLSTPRYAPQPRTRRVQGALRRRCSALTPSSSSSGTNADHRRSCAAARKAAASRATPHTRVTSAVSSASSLTARCTSASACGSSSVPVTWCMRSTRRLKDVNRSACAASAAAAPSGPTAASQKLQPCASATNAAVAASNDSTSLRVCCDQCLTNGASTVRTAGAVRAAASHVAVALFSLASSAASSRSLRTPSRRRASSRPCAPSRRRRTSPSRATTSVRCALTLSTSSSDGTTAAATDMPPAAAEGELGGGGDTPSAAPVARAEAPPVDSEKSAR